MDNDTNIELAKSQHLGFAWSSIIVAALAYFNRQVDAVF